MMVVVIAVIIAPATSLVAEIIRRRRFSKKRSPLDGFWFTCHLATTGVATEELYRATVSHPLCHPVWFRRCSCRTLPAWLQHILHIDIRHGRADRCGDK